MRPSDPLTRAERTEYRETSLHSDVLEFVRRLRQKTDRMRVESMGRSGLGQEMPVLVFGDRSPGKPVVMIVANIHAGEVEGKEVLLMLARDMTTGPLGAWLDKLCLVFVPNYNPDGNDRISPENRKLDLAQLEGQIGPDGGCGTRYTGEGINLNRDYMKLRAVESRHLANLYNRWWPHVFVDCHTTDGSIHAYALTYDTAHTGASGPREPVEYMRTRMLPEISRSLDKRTGLKTFFYGNFRDQSDPTKGWETYPALPRYGSHYRGLTGRLDILLESYSYIPFKERVVVTYEILRDIFDYSVAHADEIIKIADAAERARPDPVGIVYGPPQVLEESVEILSWDLESLRARKIPGKTLTTYRAPHYARFVPTKSVERPRAYLIPKNLTHIADKLREHGILVEEAVPGDLEAESYLVEHLGSASSPDVGTETFRETVARVSVGKGRVTVAQGDFLVRTDQRLGTLAIYLLEPESDDGLVRWGFFDLKQGAPYPVLRLR